MPALRVLPLLLLFSLFWGCHPFETVDGDPFAENDVLEDDGDVTPGDIPTPDVDLDVDDIDVDTVTDICDCVPGDPNCFCPGDVSDADLDSSDVEVDGACQCGEVPNGHLKNCPNCDRLECKPGFLNCDGDIANGCEVADVEGCEVCCGDGQSCCDGECLDLSFDDSNCGQCGFECINDAVCVEGVCSCDVGGELCENTCCPNGQCVENQLDCGSCPDGCEADETCCNGQCANLGSDPQSCGACGNVCPEGPNELADCSNGQCSTTCVDGFTDCDPMSAGCESLSSNDHCGSCGNSCDGGTTCQVNIEGMLSCECPAGELFCDQQCVSNTLSSSCGPTCAEIVDCGTGSCTQALEVCVCTDSQNQQQVCESGFGCTSQGACACSSDNDCQLGEECCGGACTLTAIDSMNCGSCGTACGSGQVCVNGTCML